MNRIITTLVISLLVQAALIFYVYMPKEKNPRHLFFDAQKDATITAVTITDKDGKTLTLKQKGNNWLVRQNNRDIPADAQKVTGRIQKLKNLVADRLTTRTTGSHARLEVADSLFQRKVEITFTSGVSRTLFIGSSPSFQTVHVRADKEKNVYLVRGMSSWDLSTEARSWWRPTYLTFDPDRVRTFSLTADKTTLFGKKEKDTWQVAAGDAGPYQEADAQKITALLNDMALQVTDYLGTEQKTTYGLDTPAATITLTIAGEKAADETTITCAIGREQSAGKPTKTKDHLETYVAKHAGSHWYVAIQGAAVKQLLGTAIKTLLVTPPKKTAEQTKKNHNR